MLLYWGIFTVGFGIGAVFSFVTFAAKDPEENSTFEQFTHKAKRTFTKANSGLTDYKEEVLEDLSSRFENNNFFPTKTIVTKVSK